VFAVNYPLQYFAERIGGDLVDVSFPAPADVDPAYWAPGAETVADYQQADLILRNGVSYAKWLERATLPATKLVNTSAGFQDRWIPLEEGPVHTHGPEGEHSHKGYAFTTWLDPRLAAEQAKVVAAALTEARPEHEAEIRSSLEALITDLEKLDRDLQSETERIGAQPLLFSHPVYQYLIARYGLNARSVHWEPEETPTPEQWQELQSLLAGHPARWMIWEGEPSPAIVERLREIGVESVVFAPCGNRPDDGDLLTVMQENTAGLQQIEGQK
jgi:zinc transport system substrate-binding protein